MTPAEICLRVAAGQSVEMTDVLTWLRRAGCGGRVCTESLGLTRTALVKARDSALLEAACLLGADQCSVWELAGRLEAAILRFESRIWPRLRSGANADLGPVDAALHRVFVSGTGVNRHRRKLYAWLLLTR
ncbi:hypothetical protein [Rhodoferax sp.]|uniref:hypothetical protein n=1 Tax=Rhodoferax sp. TaxID=50421 RepID=UPI002615569E|nr:hypothetical protein [Rhodoferax sp.]MDD3937679.1 hypothetical protein [Rhodoferax sp.]